MKTKYLRKLAYIRKKNIIENILLFGAIVSANFASYLAYYDLNATMIIDATALTKYILNFTITYIIVSTSISVVLLFIQNFSLLMTDEKGILSKESRQIAHDALGNKVFKFILTVFIFLFFYVGVKNSLITVGIFIFYGILLIIFNTIFNSEDNEDKNSIHLRESFSGIGISINIEKSLSYIYQGQYTQFLLSKIGIMLILFSLALGVGRANYVQEHILVNINEDKKTFVLYLATGDGVGLYDTELKQISFISWGNVKNLVFLSKERRSLDTLLDKFTKK